MTKIRWTPRRPLISSPAAGKLREPGVLRRALSVLWVLTKGACFTLGAMTLFGILLGAFLTITVGEEPIPQLPQKMVLYLPLEGDFLDMPEQKSFADPFRRAQPTAHELVDIIDRAASDPRVKGLMARMEPGSPFSMALSEEIRGAVKRFRDKGKFAYVYSSSYGEAAGGLGRYYLASAFQEIWMQPMGILSLGGLRAEIPFARGVLDKIGVEPQFFQRKEYKTAYESLTNSEISPANKEETQALVNDIRDEILKKIPPERGLKPEDFQRLVDKGLFTAPEAIGEKLITHADYADVLIERIKKNVTGDPEASDDMFVFPETYARAEGLDKRKGELEQLLLAAKKPKVALIYVVGLIMETDGGDGFSDGSGIAASDVIAPAILDAADDEDVKAIVLRVDSPGGSPVASESILRAVERAKKKGKPVIVSMGSVAASGGYWVSASADKIFVMPTTLTGSIGVVGGKFSAEEMWKKIGVNWDNSIQWGRNAGMWSLNTPFSDSEAERMNAMLDMVYNSFIARVAKGRKMKPEDVERVARGRVWTGARAVRNGLADETGGLREALNYAAQRVGAADKSQINVVTMPEPKTPFELLLDLLDENGSIFAGWKLQGAVFKALRPALEGAAVLRSGDGLAAYEPVRVR